MIHQDLINRIQNKDQRALARAITIVENELPGYNELLSSLTIKTTPVIGITGPPGAGKSTLVNALIKAYTEQGLQVGIIAIDPTSPFNYGSILGDRIRMAEHFTNPLVYIRSLATRGSLGGLSAKTIEITDVLKSAWFDVIIVETVGVGQSEVEIVGLADTTLLVLVPEAGDEVQSIKSGVMEIADIFVVNKSDRPGADLYAKNLVQLVHEQELRTWNARVVKAIATKGEGIQELVSLISEHQKTETHSKRPVLLAEKAFRIIQAHRTKEIDRMQLLNEISSGLQKEDFNLYKYLDKYL